MLKMLGIVLVLGASASLGIAARLRLSHRVQALTGLLQAIELITAEIEENQTPIPALIEMMCAQESTEAQCFFQELQRRMHAHPELSFSYHWQTTARDLADPFELEQPEIDLLRNASSYLGRYQAEQQVMGLRHTHKQLETLCKQAQNNLQTKGTIYRTCGIAAGVLIVLMML